MKPLLEHIALVTGASRGIGAAIAKALASEGATIVLAARDEKGLTSVADAIHSSGGKAIAIPTDLTIDGDVDRLFGTIRNQQKRLDILVNNAGVGVFRPFADMSVDEFDRMWRLNMRSVFVVTKYALPLLEQSGRGAIVNIASLAGKNSFVGGSGYAATKWALRGWAGSLMLEVREKHIRVITICPGSVDTTFSSTNKRGDHITQPEDIASAVVFAVTAPARTMFSEIDVRPTIPK